MASTRTHSTAALVEHVEHFGARVLQDALAEATANYWLRRAEVFDNAKPRPGEFHGEATSEDLSAAWRRCHDLAEASRNAAGVALLQDLL